MKPIYFLIATFLLITGCQAQEESKSEQTAIHPKFSSYWYQGKAEVNRYELSQARYGEMRKGDAVLVFVTEDFLTEKQVKKESNSGEKATPILKLNFVRKFPTGIYDYSMMSSIFSSTELNQFPHPIKISTSSQEWCGHTWLQLNQQKQQYVVEGYSYFERESDQEIKLPLAWTEDELWNTIRFNPELIPEGDVQMLPNTQYLRLSHQPIEMQKANIKKAAYLKEDFPGEKLQSIQVNYEDLGRQLLIVYEGKFPFQIVGWQESSYSGYGANRKIMTTTARLTKSILSPYWNKNSNKDEGLRRALELGGY